MLEEQKEEEDMDKKSGRQSSMTPKGVGVESKKDNASTACQRYPRNSRRKDVGYHGSEAASYARKPQPQKTRFLDKRPRSRGFYNGNSQDQVTSGERTEPEHGSVQSWGSKKTNLSHLLNFHFEPRDLYGRGGSSHIRYRKGRNRSFQGHASKYNKEHFLQANCQFIVKENGEYSVHAVDPDTLVDWDLIEQVRIYSHSVPSCPICLYPPTAAKITRCGHIYCTACILHYLSLSEKPWRRCPICYDAVQQKDLKSVLSLETHSYTAGEEITMKLMKRQRGMTLALPVDQWSDNSGSLYNIIGDVDTCYIKLLAVSPNQVQEMLDAEKKALENQLHDEGSDSLEGSYVQAALDLLKVREAHLTGDKAMADDVSLSELTLDDEDGALNCERVQMCIKSPDAKTVAYVDAYSENETDGSFCDKSRDDNCVDVSDDPDANLAAESFEPNDDAKPPESLCESTDMEASQATDVIDVSDEGNNDEQVLGAGADKKKADYYYFYQAADGQHIYPHSINARCLIKEYGSLENSPHTITARIVELEDLTMNEDLRLRLRYLSHLPVTCEFQIAELALKPPLVSKDTLRLFSGEIERKKKQRQRKNREETKLSRRIQEQENKELGIDPHALIVPSEAPSHIVPSATVTDYSEADLACSGNLGAASSDLLAASPPGTGSSDDCAQTATLSFAQMLRAGKAKPQEMMVKPTAAASSHCESKSAPKGSDSETDDEDRIPVPVYQASFGDAIQQALDKYKTPGADNDVADASSITGSKKKKKRKQKTLLFATTMNRAK